ncbi:MAG: F0F1 ATP synthase subunit delta [Propionibacteriaceae bacterium]|nr:F0F1 ATP synthase subunit delta [Propionibacteriaceae bacterium]
MSLGEDTRLSALDAVLDEQISKGPGLLSRLLGNTSSPAENLAADLFAVVDLLESAPTLRRALSDPGSPEAARRQLAHGVLDGKVSKPAANVVAEAAVVRWPGPRTFVAALERQGVRAELLTADADGQLEEVEDELFRFARLVQSNPGLRDALSDRSVALVHRQDLIGELLAGKASDSTLTLAKRAVVARERTFDNTIEGYVTLAAALKNRLVATVRVAKPLTEEQIARMQEALSRQVGRPVYVQVVLDESVLGGVRVELGDEVIEGTVAAKLENARRLFS